MEPEIEWTGEANPHCCTPTPPGQSPSCQGPSCEWYHFDADAWLAHSREIAEHFAGVNEALAAVSAELFPAIGKALADFIDQLAAPDVLALWREVERLEAIQRRRQLKRARSRARLAVQARQGFPGAGRLRVVRRHKPRAHTRQARRWRALLADALSVQ